jgi:PAS domain S-box-containing protein
MLDVSLTPAFFTATLARMAPRGQAWLIDDDSRIVASADGDPSTAGAALPQERAGRSGDLQARVGLARAAGWQVVQTRPTGADIAPDMTLLVLWGGAAALLAMLAGLGLAFLLSRRLAHPLGVLADYAGSIALASDRVLPLQPISRTREFEALRVGLLHASAVLRRRLAAERVALREARTGHDLLDSVLNATAECITVKDLDLRFVLINRAALMLGPEPLEEWQVLGRCAADICPPAVARRMEQADHAVLAEGRMTSYELSIDWPTRPQAARWLWVTTTPWQDAEGRIVGVVTVSRDVTEQRAAGFRLRGMQADLLRTTRLSAMGAMASGLAHELNQPLAAATNYLNASARLLDRDVTTRADLRAARGAVTEAAQQMLRAGAIVRRLRDFVGRGEAELQPEDVDELLRSVVDLARADGIIRGSELVLEPAAQPATVLVDRTQIQQVLLNLIRNAAEAIAVCDIGRAGEGVIRIAVNLRPSEGTAIDVIDNGPGLDPEIVERLFQPFVSTKPAGMGIGLTICHTIAEGHGGSLTVADMPGGGLRFRLSLPPVLQPDLQQAAPVGTTSGALP